MNQQQSPRRGIQERQTRETTIRCTVDLDGEGRAEVATGIGFFDHMLELLARHALIDLELAASGDLQVDAHHTVEDTGIVLGACIDQALGPRSGIQRYGWALLPMDEALARVAVDLSGRPFFAFDGGGAVEGAMVGAMPYQMVEEFWRAVSVHARATLHMEILAGKDLHHQAEALFKGAARALRQAWGIDPRGRGVPSTKGVL